MEEHAGDVIPGIRKTGLCSKNSYITVNQEQNTQSPDS